MRIVHLSDIHIWHLVFNPFRLMNKRAIGVASLLAGRARKFRLERIREVVERVEGLSPDHVLITGDLTTTAFSREFRDARAALASLLQDPARATVIPGNHDRYTTRSVRDRQFERWFGEFATAPIYPWLKRVDSETAILALDGTRSHLSARGFLPPLQLANTRLALGSPDQRPKRLIVANHYPVAAPPLYAEELARKRLVNAPEVSDWLATIGPHIYCCGHVHAAWAFVPPALPNQLCLNAGAPLLRDETGQRPPGFLEIVLDQLSVTVTHHSWDGTQWFARVIHQAHDFFGPSPAPVESAAPGSAF